jgi:hypothetical protein
MALITLTVRAVFVPCTHSSIVSTEARIVAMIVRIVHQADTSSKKKQHAPTIMLHSMVTVIILARAKPSNDQSKMATIATTTVQTMPTKTSI